MDDKPGIMVPSASGFVIMDSDDDTVTPFASAKWPTETIVDRLLSW